MANTKTVDKWSLDLLGAWRKAASELALPIASILQSYVERNFHAGMRPGLRLERGRVVGRGQRNRTNKLYRNTGRLARSFVPRSRENILRLDGDAIVYGTRVPYAAVHEYGGSRVRPRPFISPAVKAATRERILDQVVSQLLRVIK